VSFVAYSSDELSSVKIQISETFFYAGLDAVLLEGLLLVTLTIFTFVMITMATGKLLTCWSA